LKWCAELEESSWRGPNDDPRRLARRFATSSIAGQMSETMQLRPFVPPRFRTTRSECRIDEWPLRDFGCYIATSLGLLRQNEPRAFPSLVSEAIATWFGS
jgi:hypothetical protein